MTGNLDAGESLLPPPAQLKYLCASTCSSLLMAGVSSWFRTPIRKDVGPCPIQGRWKCSLQTQPPSTPWSSKTLGMAHTFNFEVQTVVYKTCVRGVFTPLLWAVYHRSSPSAPATAANGVQSRSKTQRGRWQQPLLGSHHLSSGKV